MTTYYFWDEIEDNVVREYDENNNSLASYMTEPALYGSVLSQDRSGEKRVFQFDGQGNTANLTDSTGLITDARSYTAFGRILSEAGNTALSYLFGARYGYVCASDRTHYAVRRRIMSVTSLRWQSVDPKLSTSGQSPYVIVNNSPTCLADPSGLSPKHVKCCCCCPTSIAPPTLGKIVMFTNPELSAVEVTIPLTVTTHLEMKTAESGDGRGCRIEWYECANVGSTITGAKAGEWVKVHELIEQGRGEPEWDWGDYYDGTRKFDCPGAKLKLGWTDRPNVFGVGTSKHIKFAVRVRGTAGCECNDQTLYFALHVKVTAQDLVAGTAKLEPWPLKLSNDFNDDDKPSDRGCNKALIPFRQ